MTLREFEYIVAVGDTLSFSRAAEMCYVSQPTLSSQVKKIENSLGVTIFERSNRKVHITDVGVDIIASARRVLREVAVMRETAATAQEPLAGRFNLGAFPTLASYLFPQILPKIRKALPELSLVLREEKTDVLIEELRQGTLDAAFIALPVDDPSLISAKLFDDDFYLAVPADHSLARKKSVSTDTLREHRLLLLEEGHCLRDQALDICHIVGSGGQTDYRATSLETLRQMVKIGGGITLMPKLAIEPSDDTIVYLPFSGTPPHRTIGLMWRKTSKRTAIYNAIIDMY